jgi:hypothetical protein
MGPPIAGTSSPAETFPVLAFDTTTVEYADFHITLPAAYSGGGLTLTLLYSAGTTTGGVAFEAAFRRLDTAEDIDTTVFTYDYNTATDATLPTTIGFTKTLNITFTNGADMDSLAAGESAVLRIRRATGNATDTASTDVYLHRVRINET